MPLSTISLEHLAPEGHELVLFDINRLNVAKTVLVSDPGPLTARLMDNPTLPFSLTLITNENTESTRLVKRAKKPLSSKISIQPLNTEWPAGMISLSHIATALSAGRSLIRAAPTGKRRTPYFSAKWPYTGSAAYCCFLLTGFLRLRHNPFYDLLEQRTLAWLDSANKR